MKKYEKEAFFKSFSLFFLTLILLNSIIFWLSFHDQKETLHVNIFNKIKLYNYTFNDADISIDIAPYKDKSELYMLYIKENEIFAYFDIPTSQKNSLKIIYSYKKYQEDLDKLKYKNLLYFMASCFVLFILSIFYSIYSMKPLRKALHLLEEFLKDIIHDLNTPISSILLNLKILKKKNSPEAIKRIELSTKNIGSLYNNLEASIKNTPINIVNVDVKSLINEKIEYFSYLYPNIKFNKKIDVDNINSSHDELSRILDNLISNACKYNKQDGSVDIYIDENEMTIEDTGIGIKNIDKVYERFYKESERGLGLGLDIVKKLCAKLSYEIKIYSKLNVGTKITVTFK